MKNEVKFDKDGVACCPVCGEPGMFGENGQSCDESIWIWEDDKLIAVPSRKED